MKYSFLLILALAAASVRAGDWPGFHGPDRDNKSTDKGLLKAWPEGGPSRIWEAAGIGEGYSTVAIVGKRIYTTGAIDGDCVITALDMDGKEVWVRKNGRAWKKSYPGTRSIPTLVEGLLYHLSGIGNFVCLKAGSGDVVWSKNILEEFAGRNITWGLAESPLVIGDKVICTPGGKNVSMIALNRRTGETIWKCTGAGDKPGYASPILIDYKGLKQIVTAMSESIVGVRASDGKLLWRYPHKVYADENITTPLFHDGFVIISGCGRRGTTSLELRVTGDECSVKERWRNETLDNKQGGIVLVDGRIYGYAESQNRSEPWMCIDFKSGATIFQSAPVKSSYKYKNGCLTYADGMFYLFSDDGNMALAKPTDTGFKVAGRLKIAEPGERPTWAHPVVHGSRLYLRYGDKLAAYAVSAGGGVEQSTSRRASASAKKGLAALYPGDEGIERDPRVLFVDDFETGGPGQIGARWGQISRKENVSLSEDIHSNSPGYKSIHYKDNAHLYTHTRGVDTMYARFYVKFHEKTGYIHHFVHLVADRTPTPWPKGGAGETPPGDAKFSTGIEPTGRWGKFEPPGVWNFYTYWHEMKTKWGSVYNGKQEPIEPGRWYCVEVMLKANSSPEKNDGEQAFWVDGELYGRFDGFRWRTTDKLKINSFWLLYYNTDQPARHNKDPKPETRVMEVWFDDIVIATEYIGPIHGRPKAGKKKATPSKSALLTPGLLIAEPGKTAFSQDFESGPGGFEGGKIADGADKGSKGYSFGPKGCSIWDTFTIPVKESTTVSFRLKALADAGDVQVMIWSEKLKDNCRYRIGSLKKGQTRNVEFRAMEARVGWGMKGASLEGSMLDNFKIIFVGDEDAALVLDNFKILQ